MLRALIGLIKGLIVGGGVGYGLLQLGASGAVAAYAGCALVGALVGIVCGRAPWKSETIWTPIVKMIVGGLIGVGLCALGRHVIPDARVAVIGGEELRSGGAPLLAAAVGVLYGVFVEVDDGKVEKDKEPPRPTLPKKTV